MSWGSVLITTERTLRRARSNTRCTTTKHLLGSGSTCGTSPGPQNKIKAPSDAKLGQAIRDVPEIVRWWTEHHSDASMAPRQSRCLSSDRLFLLPTSNPQQDSHFSLFRLKADDFPTDIVAFSGVLSTFTTPRTAHVLMLPLHLPALRNEPTGARASEPDTD